MGRTPSGQPSNQHRTAIDRELTAPYAKTPTVSDEAMWQGDDWVGPGQFQEAPRQQYLPETSNMSLSDSQNSQWQWWMQVLAGTERLTRKYSNHPRDADFGLSRRGLLAQIRADTDFAPTRLNAARW